MLLYTGLDDMKYMGSKNRHAKELLPIILKNRYEGQCYVKPFVGGANMIDKVDGWRIGSDCNHYLVALLKELGDGWLPPEDVTEAEYNAMKDDPGSYEPHLVGYVGFQLSYGAMWFGSYRRDNEGKRNYANEAYRNVAKQATKLKGIDFRLKPYRELLVPAQSLIYCDPPYEGTTKYKANSGDFDHNDFWQWCREKVRQGHDVFVSEYQAPDDFVCVWEKQVNSSLTKDTGAKKNTERLFQYRSQIAT